MENNQEREDLNKIRHFKGSVADFKNFWDEMAGKDTNATGTPEYQGFNNVHPTRGEGDSEHWKTSNVDEKINLKQSHLSSDDYQKAKKLKAFNADDWVWNKDTGLYDRVYEAKSNIPQPLEIKLDITKANGLHKFFRQWTKSNAKVNFEWKEIGNEAIITFRKNATQDSIDAFKKAVERSSNVALNESANSTDTKITRISSFENFQG